MIAAGRAFDLDRLDPAAQRAVFADELGDNADAAAEGDEGEDGFVAVDFGVDVGAGGVVVEPLSMRWG